MLELLLLQVRPAMQHPWATRQHHAPPKAPCLLKVLRPFDASRGSWAACGAFVRSAWCYTKENLVCLRNLSLQLARSSTGPAPWRHAAASGSYRVHYEVTQLWLRKLNPFECPLQVLYRRPDRAHHRDAARPRDPKKNQGPSQA